MTSRHEIIRLDTRYKGWSTLYLARIRDPDGHEITREIEDHGTAVAMLPYDAQRRVALLIRQLRAPVLHVAGEAELLECPAGRMDGTNPREDAIRELWEEVGLRLTHLEPLATAWMMPGVSTERIHLFLAPYTSADRTGAGGGLDSENERITVDEMALADLAAMADEGRLTDMKTLALVQTLRLRHPELFAG